MNVATMSSEAKTAMWAGAAAGATAWHVIRPLAQPYIDKALSLAPAWLAGRARDKFAAAVKSGRVPPAAVRLLSALGKATLDWSKAELGGAGGTTDEQAQRVVAALEHFPGIGGLVASDPADAAHDVAVALNALKAQLAAAEPAAQ